MSGGEIRTDGHRGGSEISSYFSPVNARSPRLLDRDSTPGLRCSLLVPLAGAAEAIRWIEVDAAGNAANTGIIFS